MQLFDRFGDEYWLASPLAEPPASWGDAEVVARWFVGELLLDRVQLPVDFDDDRAGADWLGAQLDAGSLRILRRVRPVADSSGIAAQLDPPPLLSELIVAERTWIGWEVLDPQGRPVPGIAYELNTPDGEIRTGVTDAQGRVHESAIATGTCAIRFMPTAA